MCVFRTEDHFDFYSLSVYDMIDPMELTECFCLSIYFTSFYGTDLYFGESCLT